MEYTAESCWKWQPSQGFARGILDFDDAPIMPRFDAIDVVAKERFLIRCLMDNSFKKNFMKTSLIQGHGLTHARDNFQRTDATGRSLEKILTRLGKHLQQVIKNIPSRYVMTGMQRSILDSRQYLRLNINLTDIQKHFSKSISHVSS